MHGKVAASGKGLGDAGTAAIAAALASNYTVTKVVPVNSAVYLAPGP